VLLLSVFRLFRLEHCGGCSLDRTQPTSKLMRLAWFVRGCVVPFGAVARKGNTATHDSGA
jgi:hypothetical protein